MSVGGSGQNKKPAIWLGQMFTPSLIILHMIKLFQVCFLLLLNQGIMEDMFDSGRYVWWGETLVGFT